MNKIAIITGSEGDIGKATVKRFKKEGIIVHGFDIKKGYDITDYTSMESHFKEIFNKHGKIDILINNAGITRSSWDKTLEVNLKAPYMLSMLMPPNSIIINITSLWSERGFEGNPSYGASKGGLKALGMCLAVDLAKYNIRVNNVGFGYIKTDMTLTSWNNKKRREWISKHTLLNRWGQPEDVVGLISFLCSDEAKYITGQSFYIEGGWLCKGE